ncbi:DUF6777 domain-containing protein [Actinomycetospora sp. CA-053990]|uniref:DUF6777 domain-containing protein n=1 Tax=Actinomycetospora sp. CA-053990 TaxID=3239891 RepID=UPI003D945132
MTSTDQPTTRTPVPPHGANAQPGPPPTRSFSTPGAAPPGRSRGVKLAVAAVALAIAAGTATALARLDPGPDNEYQTVSYAGADPFTAPVGTDVPGMPPVDAGGERPADTPQMYAADPAAPACDATALLSALQTDPARGTAWAQVQRIAPDQLPAYVQGLTPVVLRTPTAVVDHGYRDGTFAPTPAVLAAGTAVFVNSYGQPTVKCFSGNPLTPGQSSDPAVTTVVPAAAPIATHTFRHPATGGPVSRPGKPDTTGSGPVPTDIDGGIGDTPADPDPGTPDPGTPAPPVTGTFEYDGSVLLSDGRLVKPDGSIVTLPTRSAADTTGLPDGGWRDKYGLVYNRDGSRRDLVYIYGNDGTDFYLTPEGQFIDGNNRPTTPPDEAQILRNYDGSVTYIFRTSSTTVTLQTTYKDGTRGKVTEGRGFNGGVFTDAQGNRYNIDGSERKGADLPGGGRIEPDGTNVPPPSTSTSGQPRVPGEPQNGGVVGPLPTTTDVPATDVPATDAPVEPGDPQNGGVVGPNVDTGGTADGAGGTDSGDTTSGSTEEGSGT